MKIVIIDKKYGTSPIYAYLDDWKELFEGRGHNVTLCKKIADLPDEERDLNKYQIAIAHPEGSKDAMLLRKQAKERPSFRILFNSGDKDDMKDRTVIVESRQVYYSSCVQTEEVTRLVENGWEDLL